MNRSTRCISFALAIAALTTRAQAQVTYRCAAEIEADLAVVHINGMLTETDDAKKNLAALRPIVKALGEPFATYELDLAENKTQGTLTDAWEVVNQAGAASVSELLRQLARREPLHPLVAEALEGVAALTELNGQVNHKDLKRQRSVIRDHIRKGQRVLVVAHSQGNFYANAIHTSLFVDRDTPGEDAFRIVGVGTPAPTVAGAQAKDCPKGLCYTTFEEDFIMALVPGALPANARLSLGLQAIGDLLAHSFVTAYLGDSNGRRQIKKEMSAQLDGLVAQAPRAYDGVMTTSLEWDSNADLDLHVYELGRQAHVRWDAPQGMVGSLYPDSRNGLVEGENYAVDCADLRPGVYDFEVEYYAGQGPVTASLVLLVGGQLWIVERELDAPNRKQVPLATVKVKDSGERKFKFSVIPAAGAKLL